MHLRYSGTAIEMRLAKAGDLLLLEARRILTYAVVLAVPAPRQMLFGFLGPIDEMNAWPFNVNWTPGGRCISFGADWVLEPAGAPLSPSSIFEPGGGLAGLITIGSEGVTMLFGGFRGEFGVPAVNFNLTNSALTAGEYQTEGVSFSAWNIWANNQDREDPKARPLVSFAGGGTTAADDE